jgi:Zn-dependent protease
LAPSAYLLLPSLQRRPCQRWRNKPSGSANSTVTRLSRLFWRRTEKAGNGLVAHLLGDDTALWLGRVSLNPAKHIDPFGTIILPGLLLWLHAPFLFGYAKPVPINFRKLRSPRRERHL